MHARDERAGGVDRAQPARVGPLVDGGRDAVGREDEHRAGRRVLLALHEDGATLLEIPDDVGVVDDLAPDVDRRAVQLECAQHRVNRPLDACAVPARGREEKPLCHES